jgi:CheY-like chemotaxis protein
MVVAAEPPPAPLDHRVPDRRILVVDDVVDAGRSLARMLELAEYHVWVVHDGPSALEAVDRLHPHVVFLDIGMPEMDGLEVGRRLRARFGRDAMLNPLYISSAAPLPLPRYPRLARGESYSIRASTSVTSTWVCASGRMRGIELSRESKARRRQASGRSTISVTRNCPS